MGIKIKDKNKIPEVAKKLSGMDGKKISVGVRGEMEMIARVHEYGMDIPVTPSMRAYLHYEGIHLKPSTTHIHIPERSFLRSGFDRYETEIVDLIESLLGNVFEGGTSGVALLEAVGLQLEGKLQQHLKQLSSPPNSSMTTDRKGSSNPLVDTGGLVGAIEFMVK
ncbi:hypothetical protein [Geomicrobium sediminis]|uniref:Uncharacterized protein n=1 Tax=Geomicrobium sediminis TaxID=1347788 RepID=A0ABS2PF64_9BACL|nr:hypothetical protein [Geomicrobium sediminis]MBM7634074.1 hypothetical protein [Geomicrobium sediminis]